MRSMVETMGSMVKSFRGSQPFVNNSGPILVVDDDQDQKMLLERVYRKSNKSNQLGFLFNGKAFLDFLEKVKVGSEAMPSVVLLDINMPGLSGLEVLELVRAQNDFQDVPPILVFTSSDSPVEQQRAEQLGADGFFTKPMEVTEYLHFFNSI